MAKLELGPYQNYEPSFDDPWAQAFAQEHGGRLPWQTSDDPTQVNWNELANELNARDLADRYMRAYGRPPSMDEYRANYYGARGYGPYGGPPRAAAPAPTAWGSGFTPLRPWKPM